MVLDKAHLVLRVLPLHLSSQPRAQPVYIVDYSSSSAYQTYLFDYEWNELQILRQIVFYFYSTFFKSFFTSFNDLVTYKFQRCNHFEINLVQHKYIEKSHRIWWRLKSKIKDRLDHWYMNVRTVWHRTWQCSVLLLHFFFSL